MFKKALLLTAIFVTAASATYWKVKPNHKKQTEKALQYLEQKNLPAADLAIKTLCASTPSCNQALYRGYLEQMRQGYILSDKILQNALKEAKRAGLVEVAQEIYLARAINAWFEGRDSDFSMFVESAGYSNPHILFFEGLRNYKDQNYTAALSAWSRYETADLKDWMRFAIEYSFPPAWQNVRIAHCLIEKGDLAAGREILERESQSAQDRQTELTASLFLGLSYLKEAASVAQDQRATFFNMARFYFDHVPAADCLEKALILAHVEEIVKTLIAQMNVSSFDFIHILQRWETFASLDQIANSLADKMAAQKSEESLQFCNALKREFCGTYFYNRLSQKLLATLTLALQKGETENLFDLFSLIESLHENPKLAAKMIASLTSEEIFETIKKDNASLMATRNYLAFWEKLDRSQTERERLAKTLLLSAKLFWQNERQEKKGLKLMEIARSLSPQNPVIEKEIATFLTNLYTQAESCNMIRRLTLIHDAMVHFEINRQDPVSKACVANHLADAEYLYGTHDYPTAKTHASWVLKLDPQNEGARRLAGLCFFHLGDYDRALCYLKGLTDPDEDACRALMLSQVFASQAQGKHICQSEIPNSLDED